MPPREHWTGATAYTHLGLTLAIVMLGGFFGGYWLDEKISTTPIFAIIGTFLGGATGFFHLIRTLNELQRKRKERADENDD